MIRVTRHFVTVGERRVHYTRAGQGPVISLLHASPCSSKVSRPLQEILAEQFTVLAFDSPGFGLSDPLPMAQPETEDYADALAETLDALGITRTAVHGRHTGAQFAIEFAARHPTRCAMAITDGFPIFTAEVARARPGSYLQPLVPSWDGAHLLWLWFRYREQHVFWPWNAQDLAHRADTDVPSLDFIHRGVVELLEAGDGYRVGYSTAYRHRGIAALADLKVPVVFDWRAGDSLYFMRDRLPSTARSVEVPREFEAAARAERTLFAEHPATVDVPAPPPYAPIAGRTTTQYVDAGGGQMLARIVGDPREGTPLVILHRVPGSSFLYDELALALGTSRPVVALDLPGQGESDPLPSADQSPAALASAALEALEALGIDAFDLYAHQGGCAVAIELAARAPKRVRGLVLDAPIAFNATEQATIVPRWLEGVLPATPSWDGTHLVRAWHMRRDMALWWPWFDRRRECIRETPPAIDPAMLTIELREAMKHPASFEPAWRAVTTYPLIGRLRTLGRSARVIAASGDLFAPCIPTIEAAGFAVERFDGSLAARVGTITRARD